MREILFRGKRIDNGEWVEGNLFIPDNITNREPPTEILIGTNVVRISYEIHPSTIGQYTRLTDKNGKKIFEGDIVKWNDKIGHIVFGMGCFCVKYLMPHCLNRSSPAIDIVFHEYPNEIEIIGNIHDNSALLKGAD